MNGMNGVDLKIVLLGQKNVGKTSVFNKFIYDEFTKTSMTIGAYFHLKQIKVDEKNYNLAIWDTAGEEKFDSLTNFYCRSAKAACICYDITNYSTFESVQRWVQKLTASADKHCVILLVGNKYDLVAEDPSLRRVELGEVKRYAATINADVMEASAKSGKNIQEIFTQVVVRYMERQSFLNGSSSSSSSSSSSGVITGSNLGNGKAESKCC